ncbi:glycoside hydrolase family 1 protein [Glonium stellatum]|uniref:Glycoside hydrolase family 1 protein n=1 Tax=Glonium stellatum TaxID=574774 RepID=A0A8E2JQN1_9PEZI|nr:glycoside hydrolase family 1 protein [Glonium stellatum]
MAVILGFALLFASISLATSPNSTTPTSTVSGSTQTSSNGAFVTSMELSVEDLWDMYVGPVSTFSINTTVEATLVPSSSLIPPPTLYYPPFPTGQQIALQSKNESWKFPKDFWYGVASAAYQVEGAVKDEGRGPSIWDVLTHRVTNFVAHNDTGDIADNHYYMYKQDIARIAAMGIKAYSFSISWSRILPFGSGEVNEEALKHYDDLIDTCLQYNVIPMVTLYHWDMPLFLQNTYGGWLSDRIIDDFTEYARIVFTRWSSKVSHWFTLNEPIVFCNFYPLPANTFKATSIPPKQQPFVCGHNALLAHASAYHVGKSLNSSLTISFKNNGGYKIPLTDSAADREATQRAYDFNEGWFANPLFLTGDYPTSMQPFLSTFLPPFTAAQKAALNGSADIFAHDAYTSSFYSAPTDGGIPACTANASHPLYPACYNTTSVYATGWNIGPAADPAAAWLNWATDWVPAFLRHVQATWKPRGGIAVSEFGFAEPFEALKSRPEDVAFDPVRAAYYRAYLEGVLMAVGEGVRVVGCLAWSIFDNLEWSSGYTVKFGVQYVNLTTQERFYKASFFEYVNMFNTYQET